MLSYEKLRALCPRLFALTEPVNVQVMPGWARIVKQLAMTLEERFPELNVVQIKEKFGGLRFYTDRTFGESLTLINAAEEEAGRTCGQCGLPGKLIHPPKGWMATLCDGCASTA